MESKGKTDVSHALWVPFIWYMLGASRGVSNWFSPGGIDSNVLDYIEGTPIDRVVYLTLIVSGLWILVMRKIDWSQLRRKNVLIFLLFVYMGLSVFWSGYTWVSLKRFIKIVGSLVMVLVVLTESDPREAVLTLLRRCFYLYIPLSIILIIVFPDYGVMMDEFGNEMWIGLATQKNSLAHVTMIGGTYFLWDLLRTKEKKRLFADFVLMRSGEGKKIFIDLFYLAMVLWLLKGAPQHRSITSIFVFFFGFVLMAVLQQLRPKPQYIRKTIVRGIVIIALLCLTFQFAYEALSQGTLFSMVSEVTGRTSTISGRTLLWVNILDIASHHMVLGVGYGGFWAGDMTRTMWENLGWLMGQGHNGYIDVFAELGLVGLFLLLGIIVNSYKKNLEYIVKDFEFGQLQLTLLTMIVLHNFTESSFIRATHDLWFLFLFIAVNIHGISLFRDSSRIGTSRSEVN